MYDEVKGINSLTPAARTASAIGASVDSQGMFDAVILAIVGVITDGTHTLTVQESDDGSIWNDVAANDLQGAFVDLATNVNQKVGYIGNKRYLRVNSAVSAATTGGVYAVAVVLGRPRKAPVA